MNFREHSGPGNEPKHLVSNDPENFLVKKNVAQIGDELEQFSKENSILNMRDRVRRGLGVAGMVAIERIRRNVEALSSALGADFSSVLEMVLKIHKGGPWEYAPVLAKAEDPTVKVWLILSAIELEGRKREMDLTPQEFLQEVGVLEKELERARLHPEEYFKNAHEKVLKSSAEQFRLDEGVPISEVDNGFVSMAIHGYEAGIFHDADGLLFVGSKTPIEDELFLRWGLSREIRKDRGRDVPFFVNQSGEAVIKKIHPGFCIVLSRNFDLAKAIVNKKEEVSQEALGQAVYTPTSIVKGSSQKATRLKKSPRVQSQIDRELVESKDDGVNLFLNSLKKIKSNQIFRDRAIALIQRMKLKEQGRITNDSLDLEAKKTIGKVNQKIEELEYLLEVMRDALQTLPDSNNQVFDMAGGAGDLALAVTHELKRLGKDVSEMHVVDPFEELRFFCKEIIKELPDSEWLNRILRYDVATLQEANIPPDAVVVAKHPCGDLADTIIEKWVDSKSPVLVIMTCCQDKAQNQPARYNILQSDWNKWCKDSSKTNSGNSEQRAIGMNAMTNLDKARVEYLRRFGFSAELVQTDRFPKGDVIIARRTI